MGALAPVSPWIPEDDDFILKNAVEAGASLESLAKGAVQFSRRFTVRELQNRCHALLYDPVISADAAARMIEFERNGLTKCVPADNVNESGLKKRKKIPINLETM
ncbi:Microspherule protein 1-like protein [Drosera capensis]